MRNLICGLLAILALAFALPVILPRPPLSEAPCRMGCAAHLKQIAMACGMYKDDHGTLPASFLDMRDYLSPGRIYVCPRYFADHVKEIVRLDKTDREKLLYTSYDYLGPDGEMDATLGEMIVVREKVHHPAYPAAEPWAGHHVITRGLRVEFVPDVAGQAREPAAGVFPATHP